MLVWIMFAGFFFAVLFVRPRMLAQISSRQILSTDLEILYNSFRLQSSAYAISFKIVTCLPVAKKLKPSAFLLSLINFLVACGGIFTALNGLFSSPMFPASTPRTADCLWKIKVLSYTKYS